MLPTKKLISAMAGLAMMALPVTAMAADHHHNWTRNFGSGGFADHQNFAPRSASVQNQFVRNQAMRNPFAHNQAGSDLAWGRGFARHDHPNYALNHPNWQNSGNHPYNNGNWMANNYREWVVPPADGYGAPTPQINPYAPPPGQFAFNQPYLPQQSNCYSNNYGYRLGNRHGLGDCSSYANPYAGGYGNGNSYFGGGLMTLRNRLLQERAGAYQQLAIRERNGDTNGAHHLWNTIHSFNQQLSRVN